MNSFYIDKIIEEALKEDFGERGDLTSEMLIDPNMVGKAIIIAKEDFVLCGIGISENVFLKVDPSIHVISIKADGDWVTKGEIVLECIGRLKSIIMAERVSLNFLSWLSGIATKTRRIVKELEHTNISLLDTRKTTPTLRALEKYAVRIGGGKNHRFGLYDGILIKDNHRKVLGSIQEVLKKIRNSRGLPHNWLVEIEVSCYEEAIDAYKNGAHILLLDNMNPDEIKRVTQELKGKVLIIVSGGIDEDNIDKYLIDGVDYISLSGVITKAKWVDVSLEVIEIWR